MLRRHSLGRHRCLRSLPSSPLRQLMFLSDGTFSKRTQQARINMDVYRSDLSLTSVGANGCVPECQPTIQQLVKKAYPELQSERFAVPVEAWHLRRRWQISGRRRRITPTRSCAKQSAAKRKLLIYNSLTPQRSGSKDAVGTFGT